MRRIMVFVFVAGLVTTVPLSDVLAQSAVGGAIIGGAVGGRRGAAIGAAQVRSWAAIGGIGITVTIGATVVAKYRTDIAGDRCLPSADRGLPLLISATCTVRTPPSSCSESNDGELREHRKLPMRSTDRHDASNTLSTGSSGLAPQTVCNSAIKL
jgi:hypothetical protein